MAGFGFFASIRDIGLLGAVAAWADGDINTTALLASLWAAAQACFIRAGVTTEVQKSAQ